MLSLAIWHAATIHHGVPLVIAHGEGLPSHTASAYHARVTLRHQSSSVRALIVKGWREGRDGMTSDILRGGKGEDTWQPKKTNKPGE